MPIRHVLVTGASRGIGRAIAVELSGEGTVVYLAARTRAGLDETAHAIAARGATSVVLPMDVASEASVDRAFDELRHHTTTLDAVVNDAGVGGGQPIDEEPVDAWRRKIEVNLVGTYLVCRRAVTLMGEGGRIVNISSVLGRFGVPGYTAYCAAKHGVIGFTRALALELAPRHITVNAICPGWVDTDMARDGMMAGAEATGQTFDQFRAQALGAVPIRRLIAPEEVAHLVGYLTSPQASAVTGQTYNICGGQIMN